MLAKLKHTLSAFPPSIKSLAKLILLSRSVKLPKADTETMVIMANGPSLNETLRDNADALRRLPTLAVNFAANADIFFDIKPCYYLMVDPVFFGDDTNVPALRQLRDNLTRVDWQMTLLVPRRQASLIANLIKLNPHVDITPINVVGIEGWHWLENFAYDHALGMPRPRNVLIPAIMTAIAIGYKNIIITGADHSWMKTLSVDDQNHVISVQPHFYKDHAEEQRRVDTTYRGLRLHDVVYSFYIAFKSYHNIARYARHRHIDIINATPGSYIDAFTRGDLSSYINDKQQTPHQ